MRLAQVKPGDTVEVNVRGRQFTAEVLELGCPDVPGKPVRVEPPRGITYFHVGASQIIGRVARAA